MRNVSSAVFFATSLLIVASPAGADNLELQPDPEIVSKLEALGDNSACLLADTRIIEDLGDFAKGWHRMKETGPAGRDFSIKMAWMPDRERAFYCGANHGSPHRFNDAWEYDLPSNTWILLYTPDYNDRGPITDYDRETLVIDKGWLRTKKGGPAHPGHTWWGLTYDQELKAALWYSAWPGYRLQDKLDAIGATKEDLYQGPPLWAFYPERREWRPMPTEEPWPRNRFGASLEYLPELKGSLWQYLDKTWLLDGRGGTWKQVGGESESLPIETLVCHDPTRNLMIAHRGEAKGELPRTWHMKLEGGSPTGWKQVLQQDGLPNGHDARSLMYFDPIARVALLYVRETREIWEYNPDTTTWKKLEPRGDAPPFEPKERVIAYHDAARNVFVAIGYGRAWCYRHSKSPKK